MRLVLALSGGLVAWSFLANYGAGDTLYVTRNLVATAGLVLLARRVGLDRAALGLSRRHLGRGARWGGSSAAVIAVAVASGIALADVLDPVGRLLADDRAALGAGGLAFALLVRIPLGTAVCEEVAFRGVLTAACRRVLPGPVAVGWSSLVFGLWHIAPTAIALRINDVDPTSPEGVATVAGAVAVTTVAGVLFDLLRSRSRSLLAPVLAHWAVNAFSLAAAAATR
ncbi:CPBP family intramembrane glutamic endopeptidase [Nitriliruptor alkaliphilus]|uniref:CPBP family intramembrane glutamic endopeptidase n=1 Tax=Nitriliruptor alkaliphilus TaxID=427918 RepID=UPI0009F9C658|nr:CPBP family intramembrane glutamic endopeptidase [Nitriliruptor alkaliphilus]